jgi:hypothetical protein
MPFRPGRVEPQNLCRRVFFRRMLTTLLMTQAKSSGSSLAVFVFSFSLYAMKLKLMGVSHRIGMIQSCFISFFLVLVGPVERVIAAGS